jgi:RNA polymerase subunit RPABC4/transcription elongation factor Spt4
MLTFVLRLLAVIGLVVACGGVITGIPAGSAATGRMWASFELMLLCGVMVLIGEVARRVERVEGRLAGLAPPVPGHWSCPQCHQLTSLQADYCPRCGGVRPRHADAGTKIKRIDSPAGRLWRCPACATLVRWEQITCSNCSYQRGAASNEESLA